MNPSIKWLLVFLAILTIVFIGFDQLMCNQWVYHDYVAGIDRRLSCFWKK